MKRSTPIPFLLACLVPAQPASAAAGHGVSIGSACCIQTQAAGGKPPFFLFQTYQDDKRQRMVGRFGVFNNGRTRIPVVEVDEQQVDAPEVAHADYRRAWLEVFDRKVTGQYVE